MTVDALERIAAIERENERLRAELEAAQEPISEEQLAELEAENERLRAAVPAENEDAFLTRSVEQRDELEARARELRDAVRDAERHASELERAAAQADPAPIGRDDDEKRVQPVMVFVISFGMGAVFGITTGH